MAVRVTATEVKQILDDSDLTDAIVDAYIIGANIFVTDNLASSTLTDDTLEQIELWTTAHMITATRERMAKKEEAGGAKIEYNGTTASGFNATPYGQMVLALDSTGTIATLDKGKKAISIQALEE